MAKPQVVLVVKGATHTSKLKFPNWGEANDHIRMVILGQIIDELVELALQDDPQEWKVDIEGLQDLAKDINHPRGKEELETAVRMWDEYVDGRPDYTTIEIV